MGDWGLGILDSDNAADAVAALERLIGLCPGHDYEYGDDDLLDLDDLTSAETAWVDLRLRDPQLWEQIREEFGLRTAAPAAKADRSTLVVRQALGAALLQVGANIPDDIATAVIDATFEEAQRTANAGRKEALVDFLESFRNRAPGVPVEIPTTSLFAALEFHLAAGGHGMLNVDLESHRPDTEQPSAPAHEQEEQ